MVNQYFGRQNDPVIRPPLDTIPIGTDMNNRTTSPIESIPVRTKLPEPTPLTLPTDFPEQNGKLYVPGYPDLDPSLPDSSSKKSNLCNDINSSKSNKNKRDK